MIDKFTFYKNYYEIIRYLPDKDRLLLYDAIIKYMFEDEEPQLKNLLNGIWINLKMPLDNNKKNISNGLKGGAPEGNENAKKEKQPKNNPKTTQDTTQKQANNISYFLFLISNNKYKYIYINNNLYKKLEEWLNYKQERKEIYKPTGLETLLKQIDNKVEIYGEEKIISLIDECMASNYKGIIFDRLNKIKPDYKKHSVEPEWLDKEIEGDEVSDEIKEFARRVREKN